MTGGYGSLCSWHTIKVAIGSKLSPMKSGSTEAGAIQECQTFSVRESAIELGVCEETIRRLVRRKVLRKLHGLRRIVIPKVEIHRYLNER